MKKIIVIFFAVFSYALELVINTTNQYSVLTITNNKPFACKNIQNNKYICEFKIMPSTPVFSGNTIFFGVKPFFRNNKFFIQITTKHNSTLRSFSKNLYQGYNKRLIELKKAKKWVIISYKTKNIPFLSNKPITGLKFPLQITPNIYVHAIDENGNPIDYDSQTADVVKYFTILNRFHKNTLSFDTLKQFVSKYPNSLFLPDVLYLELKVLDEEGNSDEVIKLGNEWIRKYAFNEHLPEVLLILAKNYANDGMMEDATYMYERLFTEYQNSKFAYEGMVYLADQLYSAGDSKRAFELYKQAFAETKDLEVATLAASRIAQRYMDEGNIKQSVKYYEKILKANKKYLLKNTQNAYDLAKQLASHNAYKLAIQIGSAVLAKINLNSSIYEPLMYDLAYWNYEIGNYKKANQYINTYLNELPYGDYADQMNSLRNKVLFQIPENNTTLSLQRYNQIIQQYKNKPIAHKALLKKIALLYKLKKYKQILSIKDLNQTTDLNKTIITQSALNLIKQDLNQSNCTEAMLYYKQYKIKLPKQYDQKIFECAYQTKNFDIASHVCNKYLISTNNKILLKWLENKEKIFDILDKYQQDALIIDDICSIKKECYQYRYKQFFDYYNLNKPQQFLKIASSLINKDNIQNIDIFMKVVQYAQNTNNKLLLYTYAKKILQLQQKYKTFIQSPYIDFVFAKVAQKLNKKQEAIQALKHLLKMNISQDNLARAYYMLTSLTNNKKYLNKCIKLKPSTWQSLCKDALEVLK